MFATTVLAVALGAAPVVAQDAEGDRALDLFDQAEAAYHEGRIDDAIRLLGEARVLAPEEPVLVYNLARAYDAAGRDDDALRAYEEYLAAEPETPDRGAISARIEALRAAILERERIEADQEERLARERAEAESGRYAPWPWLVMGGGVAAVGVGIAFGVLSLSERQAAVDDPIHETAFASLQRAETDALVANVLFVAGGAVAIAGLIWGIVLLTSPTAEPPPVALLPNGMLGITLE